MQGDFQLYQLGSQVLQCSQEIISQEEKAFGYTGDNLTTIPPSPALHRGRGTQSKSSHEVVPMKLVPGNRVPGSFTANSSPEAGTPLKKI